MSKQENTNKTIDIYVDKLYRCPRPAEPCYIGIPLKQGELFKLDGVEILQDGKPVPVQKKITSRHKDGSVLLTGVWC